MRLLELEVAMTNFKNATRVERVARNLVQTKCSCKCCTTQPLSESVNRMTCGEGEESHLFKHLLVLQVFQLLQSKIALVLGTFQEQRQSFLFATVVQDGLVLEENKTLKWEAKARARIH